jgi:hypothetical protein
MPSLDVNLNSIIQMLKFGKIKFILIVTAFFKKIGGRIRFCWSYMFIREIEPTLNPLHSRSKYFFFFGATAQIWIFI